MYRTQKRINDAFYLNYAIACLVSHTGKLYCFKKDINQPRLADIQTIQDGLTKIYTHQSNGENEEDKIKIEIKELGKFIASKTGELPITIEKLSFISEYDPNLIIILKSTIDACSEIDLMTEKTNIQIECTRKDFEINNIHLLGELHKVLFEQIDYCLYMLEKIQKELLKLSKSQFQEYAYINKIDILEEYSKLRPPPEPSWESYEYKPKKLSKTEKIKRVLKQIFS